MEKSNNPENKSVWLVSGGLMAAFAASICCVGPLILTLLGISGAAALAKFDVIRIPMIVIVVLLFGVAGFNLFKQRDSCDPDSLCGDPKKFKLIVALYVVGEVIALLAIFSPHWVVWFF